jgi:uncharacterized protein
MLQEPQTSDARTSTTKGVAMITGASTGIGAVYADRLARRGHDLILVARSSKPLLALASKISEDTGRDVEVLTADLLSSQQVTQVEDRLHTDTRISVLVNNAGVGLATPLLQSDVAAMRAMITLNVETVMRLGHAAAQGFVSRGHGTIINMASIVAIAPEILNGVYGGTKAFVVAFTQSLHHELAGQGVRVQAVLPGAVGTAFWGKAGTSLANIPREILMTPEDTVDAALAGLDLGELITLPSLPDFAAWQAYEDARQILIPNISRSEPAARYRVERSHSVAS